MHKVNISIDDITPHPLSSTKVLQRCEEMIEEFNDIKFTLFIPVAYWRTQSHATEKPLLISNHIDFCNEISALPKENYEIAYHGYYHGIPFRSNNDEFQHLDYEEAVEIFLKMFNVVKKLGLRERFSPIFRPPAWRMSPEAIRAAKATGIEILALSPKAYAKETYKGGEEEFENVIYYNVNPPFEPLELYEQTEIVYHACEWDKNYLDKNKTKNLINFLKPNRDKIDFCFMKDF